MRTLFYLSESQLERIKPFFPRSHGAPRVDDRRVVSGIIYVIKHGLQWKDAPDEYGPTCLVYTSGTFSIAKKGFKSRKGQAGQWYEAHGYFRRFWSSTRRAHGFC